MASASSGSKVSRASWHSRSVCATPTLCATGASRRSTKAAPAIGQVHACVRRSGRPATTAGHRPPRGARSAAAGSGPPAPARRTAGRRRRSCPARRRARSPRTPTRTAPPDPPARGRCPGRAPRASPPRRRRPRGRRSIDHCRSIRSSTASRSARSARTASRSVTCGSPRTRARCCCHDPYSTQHHRHPRTPRPPVEGHPRSRRCGRKWAFRPWLSRIPLAGSRRRSLALAARPAARFLWSSSPERGTSDVASSRPGPGPTTRRWRARSTADGRRRGSRRRSLALAARPPNGPVPVVEQPGARNERRASSRPRTRSRRHSRRRRSTNEGVGSGCSTSVRPPGGRAPLRLPRGRAW